MPNQGHFTAGVERIAHLLNTTALQKGATAGFLNIFTGMLVWDSSTLKFHRSNGSGFDVVVDVDTAVATASLRTLGTGALQISAGNHSH